MGDATVDMAISLFAAKQQLRSVMKQRLSSIPHESVVSQSQKLTTTLLNFKPYLEAKSVSIYLSMPSGEIQTDGIVRHALASGKHVFVPYLHKSPTLSKDTPGRVMDMVLLRDIQDYESLNRDRWGIPSVDATTVHERFRVLEGPDSQQSDRSSLDLILMPGVAFDTSPDGRHIRRLGHGKGFYDFFIQRYLFKVDSMGLKIPSISLYGLALIEQLLSDAQPGSIPVGPRDQVLDGLILGNGEIMMPLKP